MQKTIGTRLVYNGQLKRWEGQGDNCVFLWMTDATFQGYVTAYLAVQGITEPTRDQRVDAVQHCRALSYWEGVQDPNIRILRNQGGH